MRSYKAPLPARRNGGTTTSSRRRGAAVPTPSTRGASPYFAEESSPARVRRRSNVSLESIRERLKAQIGNRKDLFNDFAAPLSVWQTSTELELEDRAPMAMAKAPAGSDVDVVDHDAAVEGQEAASRSRAQAVPHHWRAASPTTLPTVAEETPIEHPFGAPVLNHDAAHAVYGDRCDSGFNVGDGTGAGPAAGDVDDEIAPLPSSTPLTQWLPPPVSASSTSLLQSPPPSSASATAQSIRAIRSSPAAVDEPSRTASARPPVPPKRFREAGTRRRGLSPAIHRRSLPPRPLSTTTGSSARHLVSSGGPSTTQHPSPPQSQRSQMRDLVASSQPFHATIAAAQRVLRDARLQMEATGCSLSQILEGARVGSGGPFADPQRVVAGSVLEVPEALYGAWLRPSSSSSPYAASSHRGRDSARTSRSADAGDEQLPALVYPHSTRTSGDDDDKGGPVHASAPPPSIRLSGHREAIHHHRNRDRHHEAVSRLATPQSASNWNVQTADVPLQTRTLQTSSAVRSTAAAAPALFQAVFDAASAEAALGIGVKATDAAHPPSATLAAADGDGLLRGCERHLQSHATTYYWPRAATAPQARPGDPNWAPDWNAGVKPTAAVDEAAAASTSPPLTTDFAAFRPDSRDHDRDRNYDRAGAGTTDRMVGAVFTRSSPRTTAPTAAPAWSQTAPAAPPQAARHVNAVTDVEGRFLGRDQPHVRRQNQGDGESSRRSSISSIRSRLSEAAPGRAVLQAAERMLEQVIGPCSSHFSLATATMGVDDDDEVGNGNGGGVASGIGIGSTMGTTHFRESNGNRGADNDGTEAMATASATTGGPSGDGGRADVDAVASDTAHPQGFGAGGDGAAGGAGNADQADARIGGSGNHPNSDRSFRQQTQQTLQYPYPSDVNANYVSMLGVPPAAAEACAGQRFAASGASPPQRPPEPQSATMAAAASPAVAAVPSDALGRGTEHYHSWRSIAASPLMPVYGGIPLDAHNDHQQLEGVVRHALRQQQRQQQYTVGNQEKKQQRQGDELPHRQSHHLRHQQEPQLLQEQQQQAPVNDRLSFLIAMMTRYRELQLLYEHHYDSHSRLLRGDAAAGAVDCGEWAGSIGIDCIRGQLHQQRSNIGRMPLGSTGARPRGHGVTPLTIGRSWIYGTGTSSWNPSAPASATGAATAHAMAAARRSSSMGIASPMPVPSPSASLSASPWLDTRWPPYGCLPPVAAEELEEEIRRLAHARAENVAIAAVNASGSRWRGRG